MIYNSFNFLVIFPILFLLYYLIPAGKVKWRNGYLLLVSYLLYANWRPSYALILLGITAVTYYFARLFESGYSKNKIIVGGGNFNSVATPHIQVLQLHQ